MLSGVEVSWAVADGRPAFLLSEVDGVHFKAGVSAEEANPPTGYDIGLRWPCTGVTIGPGSELVLRNLTSV